jgi:hypothetical protein
MQTVLRAFLIAAGSFCRRRLPKDDWAAFNGDLNRHLRLTVMPKDIWE